MLAKIETGTAQIGIIGLGYVGLPLTSTFSHNYSVLGFDVDAKKVSRLELGESYIGHLSSQVIKEIKSRGVVATTDFSRLDEPDAILICVPTPLTETREPDLTYVVRAAEVIAKVLRPGQLVVLESTTYPGTTRQVVLSMLERSGLQAGKDFFLAY
ncbi:MAG: nucleotide sugar dehydrogenase, partial [Planctomycetia bacterium]|nr:nucleotide sugar dehydrogenase [Planctomycetia bacterium]